MSTIAVITGSNSGIGAALVKALLTSTPTYKIFCGARTLEKAQQAIDSIKVDAKEGDILVPIVIDLSSDETIAAAKKVIEEEGRVDVLVNNAGANLDYGRDLGKSARTVWGSMFESNVTGHHEVTFALAPLLIESRDPRLLFISSNLSSLNLTFAPSNPFLNKEQEAGWPKDWSGETPGYKASKAALNMIMLKVFSIDPGFTATWISGFGPEALKSWGAQDASIAGQFLKRVIEGENDEDAGYLIDINGRTDF